MVRPSWWGTLTAALSLPKPGMTPPAERVDGHTEPSGELLSCHRTANGGASCRKKYAGGAVTKLRKTRQIEEDFSDFLKRIQNGSSPGNNELALIVITVL